MKPEAYKIDTSANNLVNQPEFRGFGVLYKCPVCGKKFTTSIDYKELDCCYGCGQSLYWGGCISRLNRKQTINFLAVQETDKDGFYEEGLLSWINKRNDANQTDREMVVVPEEVS